METVLQRDNSEQVLNINSVGVPVAIRIQGDVLAIRQAASGNHTSQEVLQHDHICHVNNTVIVRIAVQALAASQFARRGVVQVAVSDRGGEELLRLRTASVQTTSQTFHFKQERSSNKVVVQNRASFVLQTNNISSQTSHPSFLHSELNGRDSDGTNSSAQ